MPNPRWILLLALIAPPVCAATGDTEFLTLRDAVTRGEATRVDAIAPTLRDHLLYPWVEYWQLRARLGELPRNAVHQFFERYPGQLPAHRLRGDWLRLLGQQKDWAGFLRDWPPMTDPDVELRCDALQARLAAGDRAPLTEGRSLWLTGKDLPDACTGLFQAMDDAGALSENDVWARLRLAFEAGNASVARSVAQWLPAARRPDPKTIDAVLRNPQKWLNAKQLPVRSRAQREVALFALGREASTLPSAAADDWRRLQKSFPPEDRAYGWLLIGTAGSRKLLPEAPGWFAEAGDAPMTDAQLGWKARAALRGSDWTPLLAAIDAMGAEEKERPVWRYWRARALARVGRQMEATAMLAVLANETDFHGQLAQADLGTLLSAPVVNYRAPAADINAVAQWPGLRRAIAFYRLGLRYEGNLEWIWTVKTIDEPQLLAAAELARREGWYERAIATAERSKKLVNLDLRYPAPYTDLLRASARQLDLDEAWVYGLVRQESRFVATARSAAGASGLMQIMPATARWIAGKLGVKEWRAAVEDGVDANVTFGTYYMKQMLAHLDNSPVLASAAYNAGASRAQHWRGAHPLEGAIYIDTIPFTETREYVRKVMANAAHYARQFGHAPTTLRARIGVVNPRGSGPSDAADP